MRSSSLSQLPFLEGVGGWVSENKLDCLDPTMLHYVKLLLLHRHQLRTSMTNVAVNVSLGLSDKVRCPQSSLTELRLELCAPP